MSFKGVCSFCFSEVNNENAESITDTTKEILDLLIRLDLTDRSDLVICNVCLERLFAAFEYKSSCKYTDATIIPYVDLEKLSQLDLREIYLRERDDKQAVTLSGDEQVCRLCMELTGKIHVPLQDIDKDEFQKFLPEINVNIFKDPVICKTCFDSFAIHSNFLKKLKNCIVQTEAIKSSIYSWKMDDVDKLLPIKMEEVDIKLEDKLSFDSCMKLEPIKTEIKECEEMYIRDEEFKAEFENYKTSANSPVSDIHPMAMQSNGQTVQTETNRAEIKNRISWKDEDMAQKLFSKTKLFKCDLCHYKSSKEKKFKSHRLIHNDSPAVEMHKCDFCAYETKFKRYLKTHQLIHKDPSEVQMYKCDTCDYQTKHKPDLKRHYLTHRDPSQVQVYRCDVCNYETRIKAYLKSHQLRNKHPSQVQMHKCDVCTYETKYKGKLNCHQLVHEDPSDVQIFKCGICDYEAKFMQQIRSHRLLHKDPSEVQMFKCAECSYESRSKSDLSRHYSSRHRNPS